MAFHHMIASLHPMVALRPATRYNVCSSAEECVDFDLVGSRSAAEIGSFAQGSVVNGHGDLSVSEEVSEPPTRVSTRPLIAVGSTQTPTGTIKRALLTNSVDIRGQRQASGRD
jgi:hypothetical protein